jgi:hypothetical protein
MRIDPQRCRRVRPAAPPGNCLDVRTAAETLGCHPVAEVVGADAVEVELRAQGGEALAGAVRMPRELADRIPKT